MMPGVYWVHALGAAMLNLPKRQSRINQIAN